MKSYLENFESDKRKFEKFVEVLEKDWKTKDHQKEERSTKENEKINAIEEKIKEHKKKKMEQRKIEHKEISRKMNERKKK